jgi:pilus assembly protein CpaB
MRSRTSVVISLGLGLMAALMTVVYVRGRERQLYEEVSPRSALIATRDILANTVIDEQMVQRINVPQKYLQPKALAAVDEVVGRVALVPIPAGTQLLGTVLGDAGRAALTFDIPRGMRAVAIEVSDVTGVGGLVRPGNFVDVVGTFEFGRPVLQAGRVIYQDEKTEVRTLLQNVPVVGVNRDLRETAAAPPPPEAPPARAAAERGRGETAMRTVTLLVEPSRVQELVLAQDIGTLTLALRTNLDQGQVEVTMLDPLGLLQVQIPVKPKRQALPFRDIGRGLF